MILQGSLWHKSNIMSCFGIGHLAANRSAHDYESVLLYITSACVEQLALK